MSVVHFRSVAPEGKDARIVPGVVDSHSLPEMSPNQRYGGNERPCSITTTDNSLSVDTKKKPKTNLIERYNELRRYNHARDTRLDWSSGGGYTVEMCVLDEVVPTSNRELQFHDVRQWCNETTALYWAPTAQDISGQFCSSIPFHCICKSWFDYSDGSPDMDYATFLALPNRFVSPRTVRERLPKSSGLINCAVIKFLAFLCSMFIRRKLAKSSRLP